jgi:Ca-activated chloride channel family protein
MRAARLCCPILTAVLCWTAAPALACETALLLAIDVSSSIDAGEYRLQVDGLADALNDPQVSDALVQGQVALMVVQWSGVGNQSVSLPWTRMHSFDEVARFAEASRAMPRAFVNSDTAIGDAILYATAQFGAVADCGRRVIDVSGDGSENAGSATASARAGAEAAGIIINGIAIESMGVAITGFYRLAVITHGGFVVTARGHLDSPRAIREKIRREVTKVTG